MRLVRAEPSHIEQAMRIWNQFAEFHQKIDAYYGTVKDSGFLFGDYLMERMEDRDSLVLVAMEGEQMIGYCLAYVKHRPPVFTEETVGILSDLAVDEAYRGVGAGGAMLEEAMQWLRERGVKRVELRTSARNGAAIEFYQGHGFWIYDHMMTREL